MMIGLHRDNGKEYGNRYHIGPLRKESLDCGGSIQQQYSGDIGGSVFGADSVASMRCSSEGSKY